MNSEILIDHNISLKYIFDLKAFLHYTKIPVKLKYWQYLDEILQTQNTALAHFHPAESIQRYLSPSKYNICGFWISKKFTASRQWGR